MHKFKARQPIRRAEVDFTRRGEIYRAMLDPPRLVQNGRRVLNFKILVKQAIYALVVIYAPDDLAEKRRDADDFDAVALLP